MSAGMKRPWRSRCTLAGIEARAISVKVLASRTSMNGEVFGFEEMTDDRMTPAGGRTQQSVTDDCFFFFLISRHLSCGVSVDTKASPSSSSTAPGDAMNTGSEAKHDSCFHSTCFLVTMSTFASCQRADGAV